MIYISSIRINLACLFLCLLSHSVQNMEKNNTRIIRLTVTIGLFVLSYDDSYVNNKKMLKKVTKVSCKYEMSKQSETRTQLTQTPEETKMSSCKGCELLL